MKTWRREPDSVDSGQEKPDNLAVCRRVSEAEKEVRGFSSRDSFPLMERPMAAGSCGGGTWKLYTAVSCLDFIPCGESYVARFGEVKMLGVGGWIFNALQYLIFHSCLFKKLIITHSPPNNSGKPFSSNPCLTGCFHWKQPLRFWLENSFLFRWAFLRVNIFLPVLSSACVSFYFHSFLFVWYFSSCPSSKFWSVLIYVYESFMYLDKTPISSICWNDTILFWWFLWFFNCSGRFCQKGSFSFVCSTCY